MRSAARITLILIFFSSLAGAQSIIKGKVTDASNNQGLPGTSILNLYDSTGITADENGYFSIKIDTLSTTFLFSYVGYKPYKVTIRDDKFLNARLVVSDVQLSEVIVTATNFTDKLIEVPAAISLLPRQHLLRNDESFIMPALNRIPGLFMESGSLNTNRIAIRGIGSRTQYGTNRVKVYFNDIPLTSAEGESTIEDIDINSLQRVEIIKGPSSGIYGAGLGGTINMIAEASQSLETTAKAKMVIGLYGLRNKHISLLHGTGNGYLSIGINDIKSDGYRSNSEYSRRSAIISGQLMADEKWSISFIGSFIDLKAYIPSSINFDTFHNTPSAADSGWYKSRGYEQYIKSIIGISTTYNFSENLENHTSVFVSFRDADEPRPFDILRQNSVASGLRTRFKYKDVIKRFNLQFGAELFGDNFKWSTYDNLYNTTPDRGSILGAIESDNKENRNYYNIFTQFQWYPFQKLKIEGGLNYNKTSYELLDLYTNDDIDQTGSYDFDAVVSPRISFLYSVKDSWKIFAVASHGFSMPTLATTLTPEGLINTNIQPETGMNYELGTKGTWFSGQLSGEISVYRIIIDNLLVDERIGPDQYIGINAGESVHDGLELSLSYDKNIQNVVQINTFFSLTATNYRFTDFINNDIDYSGKQISGFPTHIINVGFDIKTKADFYILGDYRMVGESAMNDDNSLYNKAYSLLNFKAGYLFDEITNFELDINVGVNNVLDEKYASMILVNAVGFGGNAPRYYYPGLPINYYTSISLSYKF